MKKTTKFARKRAHHPARVDPIAGIRLLHNARPYESGEMVEEHVLTRAAFERLRTGAGTLNDFDRVSMMFNIGLIRAEDIHPELVQTMQRGQLAFVRMKDRYLRGLPLGFDAQGLAVMTRLLAKLQPGQSAPLPLDAYATLMKAMSTAHADTSAKFSTRRDKDARTLRVWRVE